MGDAESNVLGVVDYAVFCLMLLISAGTSLYHVLSKGGQTTTKSFLLADRNMFYIPIALTMLASFISPVTLLGTPAEVYTYGGQYLATLFASVVTFPLLGFVFVPIFHGLDIATAYEYLHRRFGSLTRICGASIFLVQTAFYLAIVMYTPSLAIESVTNVKLWLLIVITGVFCTIYTALGGLEAVIWTDVFMAVVIIATCILVLITGSAEVGGIDDAWKINKYAGRLDVFTFPFDLTERMTFLSIVIGGTINRLPMWAVSQTAVQRSVWLNVPMLTLVIGMCCLEGLVMYAFYYGTDIIPSVTEFPGTTPGLVGSSNRSPPNLTKSDQANAVLVCFSSCLKTKVGCRPLSVFLLDLIPTTVHILPNILIYFVNERFGHIPGYRGLFLSCLVAASLSTISSGLNAMAAVALVDILGSYRALRGKTHDKRRKNEKRDTTLSKGFTIVFGALSVGLAFIAMKLGTIVSMLNSVLGAAGGPLVAIFLLGILWRRANEPGVLMGAAVGMATGAWITIGSKLSAGNENIFPLYKLSFMWYGTATLLVTVVTSIIFSEVSRIIRPEIKERDIEPRLMLAWLRPKTNSYSPSFPAEMKMRDAQSSDIAMSNYEDELHST